MAALQNIEIVNWRGIKCIQQELNKCQVIVGPNGSGKTSFLWAVLLLLRALNTRAANSRWKDESNIHLGEVETLLCVRQIKNNAINFFLPVGIAKNEEIILGTNLIADTKFRVSLKSNGHVTIYPDKIEIDEKIRYAFVTGDPEVSAFNHEARLVDDILSSHVIGNYRLIFEQIKCSDKEEISVLLYQLFRVRVKSDKFKLFFVDDYRQEVELLYTGTALRKCFIILIYLFFLKNVEEQKRVLAIEEIEAFMDPRTQKMFTKVVVDLAESHNIQLFITSCSSHVLEYIVGPSCSVFTMNGKHEMSREDNMTTETLALLGMATRELLIICDGATDERFLRKLFELVKIDLSKICFYVASHIQCWSIGVLKEKVKNCRILIVHDSEFSVVTTDFLVEKESTRLQLQSHDKVFYLELPCIESYLVAHHFLNVDPEPFKFFENLFDSTDLNEFSKLYMQGLADSKRKLKLGKNDKNSFHLGNWNNAICSLVKAKQNGLSSLDNKDILSLVMVLQGHKLESLARVTALQMVNALTLQIMDLPGIQNLVDMVKDR